MAFGERSNATAHNKSVVQMDLRPIPPKATVRNIVWGGCEVHSSTVRSRRLLPGRRPRVKTPAVFSTSGAEQTNHENLL